MNTRDITSDFEHYRQCLVDVWGDFASRFATEQDYDLCDLFADIGNRIFDYVIAEKHGLPTGRKAKQYDSSPHMMEEIMVCPMQGTNWCRCLSSEPRHWENGFGDLSAKTFFYVDYYDFDESSSKRKFEYVLALGKDDKAYYLFKSGEVRFLLGN